MCPKSSSSGTVSNPAPYSLADQGAQYDWTMQTADGTTTDITPGANATDTEAANAAPTTTRPAFTGINVLKQSGRR